MRVDVIDYCRCGHYTLGEAMHAKRVVLQVSLTRLFPRSIVATLACGEARIVALWCWRFGRGYLWALKTGLMLRGKAGHASPDLACSAFGVETVCRRAGLDVRALVDARHGRHPHLGAVKVRWNCWQQLPGRSLLTLHERRCWHARRLR